MGHLFSTAMCLSFFRGYIPWYIPLCFPHIPHLLVTWNLYPSRKILGHRGIAQEWTRSWRASCQRPWRWNSIGHARWKWPSRRQVRRFGVATVKDGLGPGQWIVPGFLDVFVPNVCVSWDSEICCSSCGSTLETAAVETWHQVVWVWSWTGKTRALVLWSMRFLAGKRPHVAVSTAADIEKNTWKNHRERKQLETKRGSIRPTVQSIQI